MISLDKFLEKVEANIRRVNEYSLGFDGSEGKCDCIGLIIGAIRLAGEKWTGTHGSNYSARNRMRNLRKVTSATELRLGEWVYKAKEPGEEGYDLPSKYNNSADKRDYYHVGVVMGVNPLVIKHCTSVQGGIKTDKTLGKWNYAGEGKDIDYSAYNEPIENLEENIMLFEAEAVNSGAYLNLRSGPSQSYKVLAKIPRGAIVKVIDVFDDNWWKVEYSGEVGYAMRKEKDEIYLQRTDIDYSNSDAETDKWAEIRNKAEELIDLINKAL